MTSHSPEEWRALIEELQKLINNPLESKDRRARAAEILAGIERGPTRAVPRDRSRDSRMQHVMTDMEYDGNIV